MDLDELREQVDQDERTANGVLFACRDSRQPWPPEQAPGRGGPALTEYLKHFSESRALREVAAKRAILAEHDRLQDSLAAYPNPVNVASVMAMQTVIRLLAAVYDDGPAPT